MPTAFGFTSILRFCFGTDDRQGVTLQGPQFRLCFDHLSLGQNVRLAKHTWRRSAGGRCMATSSRSVAAWAMARGRA